MVDNLLDRGLGELVSLLDPDAKTPAASLWQPLPGPQTDARNSDADVIGFGGSAGGGKLLALDTPIPTPSGWTTMGEIAVGDVIFDEQGQTCRVLVVSPIQSDTTYQLHFSDGSTLVAGASHRWVTNTVKDRDAALTRTDEWRAKRRASRPTRGTGAKPWLAERNSAKPTPTVVVSAPTVKTTQEIVDTLYVRDGSRVNHAIRVCGALALPDRILPIPAYVLGAWLGDGTGVQGSITGIDPEILAEITSCGYIVTDHKNPISHGILGLQSQLKATGLFGNKHIPQEYLRASVDQRLALLQGLMDTDGYCDPRGQCEFTTTSRALADGTQELLCSLGIKVNISVGRATLRGKDCGEKYRLKFITELPAFRLPRKLSRQKRDGFRGTHEQRYIVAAERIDPVPMRCITVDSPTHLYLAGRTMIPTHNSYLHLGLTMTEHRRSIIFRRKYVELRQLVDDGDKIQNGNCSFSWGSRSWRTPDGRMIELGAVDDEASWVSFRGRAHDYVGIDEAADFSETVFRNLSGWLRTSDPNQRTRLVLTFNPPTTAEGEWIKDYFAPWLKEDYPTPARPGELRYFARINDRDKEVAADWRGFDPILQIDMRPQSRTYFPANVKDNPYYMATDYPSLLNQLPEPLRSQLLYGDFNIQPKDDPWITIPTASVRAAIERGTKTERPDLALRAIGADAARGGGDAAAIASMWGNWIGPIATYRGQEIDDGYKLAKIIEDHLMGKAVCFLDIVGIGTSPYDILRNRKRLVYGVHFGKGSKRKDKSGMLGFANLRAEAYWRAREMLDPESDWGICLPNDRELFVDLTAPRYSAEGKVIKIESKDDIKDRIGRSPDKGDAVVMLLWGVYMNISGTMAFA